MYSTYGQNIQISLNKFSTARIDVCVLLYAPACLSSMTTVLHDYDPLRQWCAASSNRIESDVYFQSDSFPSFRFAARESGSEFQRFNLDDLQCWDTKVDTFGLQLKERSAALSTFSQWSLFWLSEIKKNKYNLNICNLTALERLWVNYGSTHIHAEQSPQNRPKSCVGISIFHDTSFGIICNILSFFFFFNIRPTRHVFHCCVADNTAVLYENVEHRKCRRSCACMIMQVQMWKMKCYASLANGLQFADWKQVPLVVRW